MVKQSKKRIQTYSIGFRDKDLMKLIMQKKYLNIYKLITTKHMYQKKIYLMLFLYYQIFIVNLCRFITNSNLFSFKTFIKKNKSYLCQGMAQMKFLEAIIDIFMQKKLVRVPRFFPNILKKFYQIV